MDVILIHIYSLIVEGLIAILWAASHFSAKIRKLTDNRWHWGSRPAELVAPVDSSRRCPCLFFCSSAGEYEQALPVIEQLEQRAKGNITILFFSASGYNFARSRGEKRPVALAPLDSIFRWKRLFKVVRPRYTFVVRYELWPAFLYFASKSSKLILVNAVRSPSVESNLIKRWVRATLLRRFDLIFAVSAADQKQLEDLGLSSDKITVCGDTKYDRVLDFRKRSTRLAESWQQYLIGVLGSRKILIAGSAWQPDIELILNAYENAPLRPDWAIVIAPHDLSRDMIEWIKKEVADRGLSYVLVSNSNLPTHSAEKAEVLIVDTLGILSALYYSADCALVGGALHFRVHNVLEPAVYGVATAFGPKYQTSIEACDMVNKGLATVVNSPEQFMTWWRCQDEDGGQSPMIERWLQNLAGASGRIVNQIVTTSDGKRS